MMADKKTGKAKEGAVVEVPNESDIQNLQQVVSLVHKNFSFLKPLILLHTELESAQDVISDLARFTKQRDALACELVEMEAAKSSAGEEIVAAANRKAQIEQESASALDESKKALERIKREASSRAKEKQKEAEQKLSLTQSQATYAEAAIRLRRETADREHEEYMTSLTAERVHAEKMLRNLQKSAQDIREKVAALTGG